MWHIKLWKKIQLLFFCVWELKKTPCMQRRNVFYINLSKPENFFLLNLTDFLLLCRFCGKSHKQDHSTCCLVWDVDLCPFDSPKHAYFHLVKRVVSLPQILLLKSSDWQRHCFPLLQYYLRIGHYWSWWCCFQRWDWWQLCEEHPGETLVQGKVFSQDSGNQKSCSSGCAVDPWCCFYHCMCLKSHRLHFHCASW